MSLSDIDNDLAVKIDEFEEKHSKFQKNTGNILSGHDLLERTIPGHHFENLHPN